MSDKIRETNSKTFAMGSSAKNFGTWWKSQIGQRVWKLSWNTVVRSRVTLRDFELNIPFRRYFYCRFPQPEARSYPSCENLLKSLCLSNNSESTALALNYWHRLCFEVRNRRNFSQSCNPKGIPRSINPRHHKSWAFHKNFCSKSLAGSVPVKDILKKIISLQRSRIVIQNIKTYLEK